VNVKIRGKDISGDFFNIKGVTCYEFVPSPQNKHWSKRSSLGFGMFMQRLFLKR